MSNSFFDASINYFFNISKIDPKKVKLLFTPQINFPILRTVPQLEITIPLPKKTKKGYVYLERFFSNEFDQLQSMWCLYLASLCHMAGHAAISNYSIYQDWIHGKTPSFFWRVIDHIEDYAVGEFLACTNYNLWQNIQKIDSKILDAPTKRSFSRQKASDFFPVELMNEKTGDMSNLKSIVFDDIFQDPEIRKQSVLEFADFMYHHRYLISNPAPFYCEQHFNTRNNRIQKNNLIFDFDDDFEIQINALNDAWETDQANKTRLIRRYEKYLPETLFNSVSMPVEDFQQYSIIKDANIRLIKKIKQQIRMINNNQELPRPSETGLLNMENTIQAIARNDTRNLQPFDFDEEYRMPETWLILIDNSASMRMRFKEIKEFMLCLSEASNELTGVGGSWSLCSFDHDFLVLKDFYTIYGQEVKARIGGLGSGGLSFTPDALLVAGKQFGQIPGEKKNIFVFTDDYPTGSWKLDEKLYSAVREVERMGVNVIGIGLTESISKYFKSYCYGTNLRDLVSKFIRIYRETTLANL